MTSDLTPPAGCYGLPLFATPAFAVPGDPHFLQTPQGVVTVVASILLAAGVAVAASSAVAGVTATGAAGRLFQTGESTYERVEEGVPARPQATTGFEMRRGGRRR